jgi:lysophospholipase L1-like esterase
MMLRLAIVFLCLHAASSVLGQLISSRLVADYDARAGVTTNADGYVSNWSDQHAILNADGNGPHDATQATDALKPKLVRDFSGRLGLLFHSDPAITTISNCLAIPTSLTNWTQGVSVYAVANGQTRAQGTTALLTLSGFAAMFFGHEQHPSSLYKYIKTGGQNGTFRAYNNVCVLAVSSGTSSNRLWRNLSSENVNGHASVNTAGGTIGYYDGRPFEGMLYRLLIYDTEHSQAESDQVINALVQEHGIVTNYTAVCVARGDSMTEAVGQTNLLSWPIILSERFTNYLWVNAGWGARRIGSNGIANTAYTEDANLIDPYYDASKPSWLLSQFGINDISSDGLSGAVAFSRLTNWTSARKAAGWKVGLATLPHKASLQTQITDYNAAIRSGAANFEFISDSGYNSAWGETRLSDASDADYFQSDEFHINTEGQKVVAGWFQTNINAYIGRNFHVATNGNDSSGNGSESAPWLTVQNAIDTIVAGDTATVHSGVYTNEWLGSVRSGSSQAPITIRGDQFPVFGSLQILHSNLVVEGISFQSMAASPYCLGFEWTADSVLVRSNRFELTSSNKAQVWMAHGDWGIRPTRITIDNNQFLDTQYYALSLQGNGHIVTSNYFSSQSGGDAVYLHSCNTTFKCNVFTNWSRPVGSDAHTDLIQAFASNGEIATNNTIERNMALNCAGTQIGNLENQGGRNPGVQDWVWRNNIWANVEAAMSMTAPGMHFYNNVFYRSGTNTGASIIFRGGASTNYGHNGRVFNNIFFECGSDPTADWQGWYSAIDGVTNFVADYNLVIGSGAGTTKGALFAEDHGVNGQDPQFVSAAGYNLRLQASSPARQAGADLSAFFTDDFTGTTRVAPWDIGAYEYFPTGGTTATAGTVNVGTLNIAP